MSERIINIGILGCADIADRFIIPSLKEMKEFKIIGIASRTEYKAKIFAKKFKINAFYSYESLLDNKELDALYIPLPNSLHYTWIKKAFQKNLNVLVEKSMALKFKEVVELNNLAQKKSLVLIENFQFRFHEQIKCLKNLVKSGKIGNLRNIKSYFGIPLFKNRNNIRYQKNLGGGALLDVGVYTLKISQIFLGQDISIKSATLVTPYNKEVDFWGSATIKKNTGNLVSQVAFGFDNFYQNSIELWGSKGRILANRVFTSPPGLLARINIETDNGIKVLKIKKDNHFKNILKYFYNQIISKEFIEEEYKQNINQARLVKELKVKANER
jgi:NDP-hexose-3-ketoreductase